VYIFYYLMLRIDQEKHERHEKFHGILYFVTNICACWSMPIRAKNGKVLGSFALSSVLCCRPDARIASFTLAFSIIVREFPIHA